MHFTELRYQDPRTRAYLGSPSLVRLPDGALLATHDTFGPGCPLNAEDEEHLTSVYRSTDHGTTWTNLSHIAGAFWSSLFLVGEAVYLLGCSQQYGSIVIRRSTDGGFTWTHPRDGRSGLLFAGGPRHTPPNYHCAPVPVLEHAGWLYRAFEDNTPLHWPKGFQACVISADAGAELLDASSWRMSERLPFDQTWLGERLGPECVGGWLEGNLVADRAGQLWNLLRVNGKASEASPWTLWNTAALVRVDEDGTRLRFDPTAGFIRLPGGHTKFTVRYDPETALYLTLSNAVADPARPTNRSVLALVSSPDLRTWTEQGVLLRDDSGLPIEQAAGLVGFQYVDWQLDGEDLIALVRTAYGGAHNFHDSNRITFHRVERFRQLIQGR